MLEIRNSMNELIQISDLSKSYAGVNALHGASLTIAAGEVHALCGENGAGKSTLIKCLSGVVQPDDGTVKIDGKQLSFGNVAASEALGIAVIHQESTTFPHLSVVDNIFVGRALTTKFGLLDHRRMRAESERLMSQLGQNVNVLKPVNELSMANRQMVTMARALSQKCKVMIMDEPTASLSNQETDALLNTVRQLQSKGVAILYVSHRLNEIFDLADKVTVLRDGQHVQTSSIGDIDEPKLIKAMVGREPGIRTGRDELALGEAKLEVHQLCGRGFQNVSLDVRAGEIVGLAGLIGAGRSELAKAIVGLDPYSEGEVFVSGERLPPQNIQASMAAGVALVPEDRQSEGLVLPMSVSANLSMTVLERFAPRGFVRRARERQLVSDLMKRLDVRAPGPDAAAESLSGGNQQKLVIGKWLATEPTVLILDEPTRGVDVGAKAQVHQLIRELAAKGLATLVISSELPELISLTDRILVMQRGSIAGEVVTGTTTQEQILELALPTSSTS